MKIFRILSIGIALVFASACTLDLREDPNAVQLSQSDVNLSLNAVQLNFAGFFSGASGYGEPMVRMTNSGGSRYNNVFTPNSFSGIWSTAYSSYLADADALIKVADARGLYQHTGMARVMTAYVLVTLVDLFGDVPYTEALQGSENFNPAADSGAEIYAAAFALLDRAIVDFDVYTRFNAGVANYTGAPNDPHPNTDVTPILNPTTPPFTDLYYGGNVTRWKKLANTIKLKMYLNWRVFNEGEATTGINAVLASADGLISAANENFIFRYGTNTADPDARHPNYGSYIAGGGTYMSNHLIWSMLYGYQANEFGTGTKPGTFAPAGDPRMRFYFYRQTASNSSNPNEIRCVTEPTPLHYPFPSGGAVVYGAGGPPPGISTDATNAAWSRTYCYPSGIGYWGRDHVDNQGIPPDGFLRTTWGAYPSGGRFDVDAITSRGVTPTMGMRGAGFQPIMMRSFVSFMLAEAEETMAGVNAPQTALQYFTDGMNRSFTDVRDWAKNGTYSTTSVSASPTETTAITGFYSDANYTANVTSYVASATAAFTAGATSDDRLNFIAREYWIAAFENGVEMYNMYRRTGKPTGMQPALDPQPGAFPQSWWYPQTYVTLNSNAEQKADLTTKIFWFANVNHNLDF